MEDKPVVRCILFDIDDTLYSTSEFAQKAYLNAVEAMIKVGLKLSHEVVLQELQEVLTEFASNYPFHFDKLLRRLPPESFTGINRAVLIAAAVAAYHDTKHTILKAYPDAIRVLQSLSTHHVIRGIITAGLEVKQAEKLIRLNVYPYLHPEAIFISDQIGISKPNPKLYQFACKSLRLSPYETAYVGDHPEHDIDPANHIGMITVRMRRSGKYSQLQGKTMPRYEINNFDDLLPKLEKDFVLA
jgi:putative hydrolase of the HAD superfamily